MVKDTEESPTYKDRECISCEKLFDCPGKPRGNQGCLQYEERKK